jgi:hypothetical protein
MATNTYVALHSTTLTSAVPSVTISSIDQTYTDLVLVANFDSSTSSYSTLTFNGVTGTSYSRTRIITNTSAASSDRTSNAAGIINLTYNTAGTPVIGIYQIFNYANTTRYKTAICRDANAADNAAATIGLFRGSTGSATDAINSITLTKVSGNFAVGSTFNLYGIRAESVSPTTKATGGTVYSDSTYYYHVFGESGTFTPNQSITADILVVAGGGGGGDTAGGGGGAGGLLGFSSQSLTATGYTVTVGSGGTAGSGYNGSGKGGYGGDSQFGSLTLVKGGGGGGDYTNVAGGGAGGTGLNGGSGGGGGSGTSSGGAGGSATSGQGYAGGAGAIIGSNYAAGGGGGAGAIGSAAVSNVAAGNGGIGLSTYSSWGLATGTGENVSGTYYYAGGGGGAQSYNLSSGGYGGGGAGGSNSPATRGASGTANTGGGGGGGRDNLAGSGGSGIVIVRYAK